MTRRRIGSVRLIANSLVKKGVPRKKAFKIAWNRVKKNNIWD